MQANKYFKENLLALKESSFKHLARAKYKDGTESYKTSIYQVFEKYKQGEQPIHNIRETAIKSALQEVFWIYQDQTSSLDKAHERGIYWWDDFNVGDETIGEAYGNVIYQHDMLNNLLYNMIKNPFSQRHILSLWQEINNVEQYSNGGLVPCAFLTQYTILKKGNKRLVNMHLQIRSSDYITAGAINRIQYYALGLMICGHLTYETGLEHILNDFSVFTMDMHIYDRHEFAIDELLNNESDLQVGIKLNSVKNFYEYTIEDFEITKPKELYKLSKQLEIAV